MSEISEMFGRLCENQDLESDALMVVGINEIQIVVVYCNLYEDIHNYKLT
jgi:hypothetical protein